MLKLFLWLRYLRKRKIVFLSIAAVALSVSLLIVVASLFTSFINTFEQSAVETIGDIVLSPPIKFTKYELFLQRLEQTEQVEAATATLSAQGLLHLGKGNVRAVNVWGIDPGRRANVTGFKRSLLKQKDLPGEPSFEVSGFPETIGGFVGIGVLAEPDEQTDQYDFDEVRKMLGQQVFLTTGAVTQAKPGEDETELSSFKRKFIPFLIADIVFTGVYLLDKEFVYLPIEELQKRLYPSEDSPIASQIQIKLSPGTRADVAMAQIRGLWQGFVDEQLNGDPYLKRYTDIETAKQMQSRYVAEIRKQMGVLLSIFSVVSLTVVVLVFCIFYMIVMSKQKDIAIIKSCGAGSGTVASIFMAFGLCVGIIGSGLGVIFGYIVIENINSIEEWVSVIFGLKLWKSSVYMFSKIPNEVNYTWALLIVSSAIAAAVIGTLIPAVVAAWTKPVNILRYE